MASTNSSSAEKLLLGIIAAFSSVVVPEVPTVVHAQPVISQYKAQNSTMRPLNDFVSFEYNGYDCLYRIPIYLPAQFTFSDKEAVDAYLAANPEISPRLHETTSILKSIFLNQLQI
jgi:hypothetical protein